MVDSQRMLFEMQKDDQRPTDSALLYDLLEEQHQSAECPEDVKRISVSHCNCLLSLNRHTTSVL